jgi:hypothetical protein
MRITVLLALRRPFDSGQNFGLRPQARTRGPSPRHAKRASGTPGLRRKEGALFGLLTAGINAYSTPVSLDIF